MKQTIERIAALLRCSNKDLSAMSALNTNAPVTDTASSTSSMPVVTAATSSHHPAHVIDNDEWPVAFATSVTAVDINYFVARSRCDVGEPRVCRVCRYVWTLRRAERITYGFMVFI